MPRSLEEILAEVQARQVKGHPKFYKPLEDPAESQLIRTHYALHLPENVLNTGHEGKAVYSHQDTFIADRVERVVIGDYGAYYEIQAEDMCMENIEQRWPGEPKRPVKYIWMQTKDKSRTKIYKQVGRVSYADYLPGYYYVDPRDVVLKD